MDISHITTVHPRFDTRIFYKECLSLAAFFNTTIDLFVLDGLDSIVVQNVRVNSIGSSHSSRILRILKGNVLALKSLFSKTGVIHFHDPELLFAMFLLSISKNKKVIFDVHENVSKDILTKDWIPFVVRPIISRTYLFLEKILTKRMSIVIAEDSYLQNYRSKKCHLVHNYADVEKIRSLSLAKHNKIYDFVYIGACSINRGILNNILALKKCRELGYDANLLLIGRVDAQIERHSIYMQAVKQGWVVAKGRLTAEKAWELASAAKVGLSTLLADSNFIESYPTKLFEYMSLPIPTISSDFPLYKSIIEEANCGLCVNPGDIDEIQKAMQFFLEISDDEYSQICANGLNCVEKNYNWQNEKNTLFKAYADLMS